jgi:hypothetical protein
MGPCLGRLLRGGSAPKFGEDRDIGRSHLEQNGRSRVQFTAVRLALDRPLVFPKAKDRPVVISALAARCAWLLTLDETDFHGNLGREIYGMSIATPGQFLIEQRHQGLL